jgi:hypothetical protein
MIQDTRCQILEIYTTTGHLGFEFVGYTIFLNFGHGKANAEMEKPNFSSIAEGDRAGSQHKLSNGLPVAMMILEEVQFITATGKFSSFLFSWLLIA